MTPAEFRAALPAFADEEKFPESMLALWLDFAAAQVPAERWGNLRSQGVLFLAAHHLTLVAAASKAADGTGGLEAASGGVTSESKTVGSVSKSVSRSGGAAGIDPRGGQYNDTSWGRQYWALASTIGAGGLVL
ncbi:DUF4054 domain-containing protein [Telmatospirillum sp. J64-1]|uniref:DUF4054 domain-containing protein n=1 Tax=Telmatospirillum sp. J64-1 TaxID=2502183 RepID=UPI00115DF040|nr:DUF4054 domain-containing protein [Telmatospirillum sp. J64-1]